MQHTALTALPLMLFVPTGTGWHETLDRNGRAPCDGTGAGFDALSWTGLGCRHACRGAVGLLGGFELDGRDVADGRVSARWIVDARDEPEDGGLRRLGREAVPVDQLAFEGAFGALANATGPRALATLAPDGVERVACGPVRRNHPGVTAAVQII